MIPAHADTFVGLATGGPDVVVRLTEGGEGTHPEEAACRGAGSHTQVFVDGCLQRWTSDEDATPDLCVHLPHGATGALLTGTDLAAETVTVHRQDQAPQGLPPADLHPPTDMIGVAGATLTLLMIQHDSPVGTITLRQRFVDGVPVAYEWGPGEAHVIVHADYCSALAYRSGDTEILDTVGTGSVEGSIPMVSLAAGVFERPEYRAHLAANAELCRTVRHWAEHLRAPVWRQAQALEATRGHP